MIGALNRKNRNLQDERVGWAWPSLGSPESPTEEIIFRLEREGESLFPQSMEKQREQRVRRLQGRSDDVLRD